jgi:predicted methyltransferase
MKNSLPFLIVCIAGLALSACSNDAEVAAPEAAPEPAPAPVAASEDASEKLAAVIAGDHRSAENKARDQYRNPAETLEFFSVTPDATVVEIWPGGGWYTEILAPYLRDEGRYIGAGFDRESNVEFIRMAAERFQAKLDANPELYDKAETAVFMPPGQLEEIPENTADVVLTFRSIHNWMPRGNQDAIFAAIYRILKPGGVLGVVEHRGDPAVPQDPEAKSGYVNQDYAIELAEKAGFVLNGSSEINANPRDIKDYPEGVWTLPPTLRLKEQGRETYLGIGESDRFTLRFIKPVE